jgi:hypothetical protein
MEISFVRTQGSPDRIYVHRADGSEVSWSFPTYGDELPHDLVHVVVEAAFGVRDGIWARVDAGADLGRSNAQANKKGGAGKYDGTGLDHPAVLLSEALANGRWGDPDLGDAERLELITAGCAGYSVPVPASVTVARIAEVREALDRLRARWRALLPKGALRLAFDPTAPERSFAGLVAEGAAAGLRHPR